jgi:hypothetical protein
MWGVLDPPEVRRKRSGSFYRRWTWRKQIVASGTRLLVVGTFTLLLWGGWYLANKGFGREFRTRVVQELRKRGIDASVRKLTLDPFRGLVARDLRIYDAKNRITLLSISEVALDINYAALLHRQPFLNAIDVRNADVTIPGPAGDPNAPRAQLKEFRAHVYFPPDQIHISHAEGIFCGVRISATGQLLNRPDPKAKRRITEAELQQRMELLQRIAVELGKFHFAGRPPSLQMKFTGDLGDVEKARAEITLSGERIQRGPYEMKAFAAAAEWIEGRFNLTQCEWTDPSGAISASASWQRLTNRVDYQVRSSIALKPFLEAIGFGKIVADLTFASAPQLELSGSARFGQLAPQVSALGHLQVDAFTYKGVALSDLSADLSWDGERTLLRDVRVRHASGELSASLLDAPGDFRLDFESSVNPVALRALAPGGLSKFLGEWELPRSPAARMSIRGASRDPETWSGDGTIALQRARFRGVWMNSATAKVHLGKGAVGFTDLHVVRDEGIGTGAFTYDYTHHEVHIDNVRTHLRPNEVIYWIEPKLFKIVAPYKFRDPPHLLANGVVHYRGGATTHLTINVDAAGGMDYVFIGKTLPLEHAKGNLLITKDRVQLNPVEGGLFGGMVRGNADIFTPDDDPHYSATVALNDVDFPKLTKLYFDYETSRGQLDGKYTWQASGDDTRTMVGQGEVKVSNGDVFAIPVFGPLSGVLNSIVPGAGYSIAKQATASFNIKDGVIRTDDFKVSGRLFGLVGHGTINFIDDRMNLDVRISAGGPGVVLTPLYNLFEYRADGTLAKPNWHAKNF